MPVTIRRGAQGRNNAAAGLAWRRQMEHRCNSDCCRHGFRFAPARAARVILSARPHDSSLNLPSIGTLVTRKG